MTTNPFLAPTAHQVLYGSAERLTTRTSALHRAKIAGHPVPDVIAELATSHGEHLADGAVADLGCGRGTTTCTLAQRLHPTHLIGIDASSALLVEARHRANGVSWVRGDFHALPLRAASCSLVVAAFCLYHSPHPERVISEIARCLLPGGIAILVTKSADSYRELDEAVAASGLDPDARTRPSLYASAHSDNLTAHASTSLRILNVKHEEHRFRFSGAQHLADYLATTPKYRFPPNIDLAAVLPDQPLTTTSIITYVVGGTP